MARSFAWHRSAPDAGTGARSHVCAVTEEIVRNVNTAFVPGVTRDGRSGRDKAAGL